jgi:hypothetical protein
MFVHFPHERLYHALLLWGMRHVCRGTKFLNSSRKAEANYLSILSIQRHLLKKLIFYFVLQRREVLSIAFRGKHGIRVV